MAQKVNVTRQAVSRWETGETQPNPENKSEEERRIEFDSYLSQLKHWK